MLNSFFLLLRLSIREKWLLLSCLFWSGYFRWTITHRQFSEYEHILGVAALAADEGPFVPLELSKKKRLNELRIILEILERRTPWTTNCLVKACVASKKIRSWGIPYRIYLGVKEQNGVMAAHAWTIVGKEYVVTGFTDFDAYTVTSMYRFII